MPILAVLGYVAGQLAAAPHAHDSVSKHDARPHIHLSGFGGGHHHHDHDHCDAHDDHAAAPIGQSVHDDDAVYLQVVTAGTSNASPGQVDLLERSTPDSWLPPATASPSAFEQSLAGYEPCPHSTGDHCALFLTLQSLRI
jgi:hypothetical protein